jgi:hypothetical protein
MSASVDPSPLGRTSDQFTAHVMSDNQLASMTRDDLRAFGRDIGMTEAEVREVSGDHSALMEQMMRARGLDPVSVRRDFGGAVREMEKTCARCQDSGRCFRELEAGTSAARYHVFCPNACAMDNLLAVPA